MHTPQHTEMIIAQTRQWLEQLVLAHNLCPFAHKPYKAGQVRFRVSDAARPEFLLEDLLQELQYLRAHPASVVETTLLLHPGTLEDFYDYNDFLDIVDNLLVEEGFEGEFQIASFHPAYQFADTPADDASNYTNRSPWPMLHILREASLEQALLAYPDFERIPERNIAALRTLGIESLRQLQQGETA